MREEAYAVFLALLNRISPTSRSDTFPQREPTAIPQTPPWLSSTSR